MKLQLRGALVHPTGVFILGTRNGRRFYRISTSGAPCFAIGQPHARPASPFGLVFCAGGRSTSGAGAILSAERPVSAFASVEGTMKGIRNVRVVRIDGFATDAVAKVEFRDATHATVASAVVSGNVFSVSIPDIPLRGGRLVAEDQQGNTVYTEDY